MDFSLMIRLSIDEELLISEYPSDFMSKEQEVLAYILRNEYNEYRLEPSYELNIRQFPIEAEVKLIALPSEVK
jgi:hypothetical protein